MRVSQSGAAEPLKIAGDLQLYSGMELRDALSDLVGNKPAPIVDLSEVESCDLAGMQILCAAIKTAESAGKQLTFSAISPSVVQCCRSIGLSL